MLISEDFVFLGQGYEWWEDSILLVITLITLGCLIYAWRYTWLLLKSVSKPLYLITFGLIVLQYLAENYIGFSHVTGNIVEELCEIIIYSIAFVYLLRFKVDNFNSRFLMQTNKS